MKYTKYVVTKVEYDSEETWQETEKDINDMILAGHNVMSVLECNTYSDLEGTLKLTNWKKT